MFVACIDIGGTFTDLVLHREGADLEIHKSPTTPGEFERGLPPAAGRSPPHFRQVVPGRAPLEGHQREDQEDPDGGPHDEERQHEESDDEASGRRTRGGLFVVGEPILGVRPLAHRTDRYRFACVIGFGTKIASLSQTVSQRRQETHGPASTSAILWNVSWRGSSIR